MFSQNLGHFSQLGAFRKLPRLILQTTENTWVTCPLCRGGGLNSRIHDSGQVTLNFCPRCEGRKNISNRID